jgi:hypothetical protein
MLARAMRVCFAARCSQDADRFRERITVLVIGARPLPLIGPVHPPGHNVLDEGVATKNTTSKTVTVQTLENEEQRSC